MIDEYWSMENAPWDMRSLSKAAAAAAERNWFIITCHLERGPTFNLDILDAEGYHLIGARYVNDMSVDLKDLTEMIDKYMLNDVRIQSDFRIISQMISGVALGTTKGYSVLKWNGRVTAIEP